MDKEENIKQFIDIISNYSFVEVSSKTRFWIIRTKKGYFYHEFLINQYIGLGWNTIDKKTDVGKQSIDILKQRISNEYKEKRPASAINKCINFIYNIKEGDILVIPSAGSKFITFARAGEYFEAKEKTYELEREIISKIDTNEVMIKEVDCPYKKRRSITILKTIRHEDLNIKLSRALTSYHGISNLDSYSEYILDAIYDNYLYNGNLLIQFNITKTDPIKPREISGLMYGLSEYLCRIIDEDYVSATIYLNSPGKTKISLKDVAKKVEKGKWYWLIFLVLLTGGKAFTFEFPGVVQTLKDVATMKDEIEIKKIEKQTKELELIKLLQETGVDIEELSHYTDVIIKNSELLNVQPEEKILIPEDDELKIEISEVDEADD